MSCGQETTYPNTDLSVALSKQLCVCVGSCIRKLV